MTRHRRERRCLLCVDGLLVVEDCALALGARYHGMKLLPSFKHL
jgi:dTDP-4-amino-4,6-dideoxygalactose transaminase